MAGRWFGCCVSSRASCQGRAATVVWMSLNSTVQCWACDVHSSSSFGNFTPLIFPCLEKEMATRSNVLAWRTPGMAEPGGLPSMGSHRVRHDWSDLAAAAAISHVKSLSTWITQSGFHFLYWILVPIISLLQNHGLSNPIFYSLVIQKHFRREQSSLLSKCQGRKEMIIVEQV